MKIKKIVIASILGVGLFITSCNNLNDTKKMSKGIGRLLLTSLLFLNKAFTNNYFNEACTKNKIESNLDLDKLKMVENGDPIEIDDISINNYSFVGVTYSTNHNKVFLILDSNKKIICLEKYYFPNHNDEKEKSSIFNKNDIFTVCHNFKNIKEKYWVYFDTNCKVLSGPKKMPYCPKYEI